MASSTIKVLPAQPSDMEALARVEFAAFENNEFGLVAFGRPSEADIIQRAQTMGVSHIPGEVARIMKAVMIDSDGKEEIVGLASWRRFTAGEVVITEGKDKSSNLTGFACPELFVDGIVRGEELMKLSSGDKDYLKLNVLAVSPRAQRRGVGSKLLNDGLQEADEAGIQTVLAASEDGEPLYRRHGFIEYEKFILNLSDYKGGEGKGMSRHVIMNRPARATLSELE